MQQASYSTKDPISILSSQNISQHKSTTSMAKVGKCPFHIKNPVFCHLSQTNQGNVTILKLEFLKIKFQMRNSVFGTSSYNEHRVFHMVLEFMELEFQKKKKISKSTFAITRYSKNRVIT